jgi:hypothetical protein
MERLAVHQFIREKYITLLTMLNNSVVNSFDGQDGWADGYSLYGLEKRGSIDGYREKR